MVRSRWQIMARTCPTHEQEVLDILLANRGVDSSFLNGALADLEDYLCIRGLDEGAEIMAAHLAAGHKIVLVSDYDCDGITSAAQMSLFLKDIGYGNYEVVIPMRSEGYGLPERAVRDNADAKLFVVMDCGTLDREAVSLVREQGSDCIVIDHHEVPAGDVAPATVLINPKQPSCPSRFKEICASGLTLLFLTRLRRAIKGRFSSPSLGGKYLALASIGTIADIVPLLEANRILARHGLSSLNARTYLPVQRIMDLSRISARTFTAGHVGYFIGPRINAAGRVDDPRVAFDLLMADHPAEIDRLAQQLERLNAKRQSLEEMILRTVRRRFTEEHGRRRTVVMGDADWHPGIIGIVASRIQQEIHYGPTVVCFLDERRGIARGSARSVPGFNIHAALGCCADLLIKWGGHKMAAGLTLALDRMDDFAERFECVAAEQPHDVFIPKGRVDMQLNLDLVSTRLLTLLKQLEPHGQGNPSPTFAARNVRVKIMKTFGKDRSHLRLAFDKHLTGVFWRGALHCRSLALKENEVLDAVFQVEWDDFNGKPVLNVKDLGRLF
jgi:single-stranded-DNA-specific exonuclease